MRFAKRDNTETANRGFIDKRSFVSATDGSLRLYGKDWGPQRKRCRDMHEGKCHTCNRITALEYGEAHHIEPRGTGGSDNLANLMWLCKWCHRDEHGERNTKWTRNQSS